MGRMTGGHWGRARRETMCKGGEMGDVLTASAFATQEERAHLGKGGENGHSYGRGSSFLATKVNLLSQ